MNAAAPLLVYRALGIRYFARGQVDQRKRIGDIYVYPGRIVVAVRSLRFPAGSKPTAPELVTHQSGLVTMNVCHFPPWYNTVVFVVTPTVAVAVGVDGYRRRRLARAITSAGFEVRRSRRWYLTLFTPPIQGPRA